VEILAETETYRDVKNAFGSTAREWKNKSGVPGHSGWECEDPDIWRETYRPAFEQQPVTINIEQMRQRNRVAERYGRWRNLAVPEVFEVTRQMMGDELFLMSLLEEPEWVAEMARVITDCTLRNLDAVVKAGVEMEGLWIYGDMAFKTAPFCSPACYRELIQPQHRRLAEWANRHELPVIYHSDGDIRLCLEDLLDAGFEAFHPLERNAGMDVAELAPRIGGRALLMGNVSVPVLIEGDPEAVEAEVLRCLKPGMEHGCYIYHSDHSLPPEVSWETIMQVKALLDQHGVYPQR
jgi:uroporphyrinogen decarboxylase